jgi:hypothetical protein
LRRHAWVVRMTSHTDLVLRSYGNDAIEEVCDPLPVAIGFDFSGARQRLDGFCGAVFPGTEVRASTTSGPFSAHNAEQAHVVLDGRYADLGAIANQLLDFGNILVPFGAFGEHDRRARGSIDVAGGEKSGSDTVETDLVLLAQILAALEIFEGVGAIRGRRLRVAADVVYAMPLEKLETAVVSGTTLATEFELDWFGPAAICRGCRLGSYRRREGSGGCALEECSTLHGVPGTAIVYHTVLVRRKAMATDEGG